MLLVEKEPSLGAGCPVEPVFPKLCPPGCGLEIVFKRLAANSRFRLLTSAEVIAVSGGEGSFEVVVSLKPTFVKENCTGCGRCAEACPAERPNTFNFGLDRTKAIYLPHRLAFPYRYVIDGEACWGPSCSRCEACPGAIDLRWSRGLFQTGSVIWAADGTPTTHRL